MSRDTLSTWRWILLVNQKESRKIKQYSIQKHILDKGSMHISAHQLNPSQNTKLCLCTPMQPTQLSQPQPLLMIHSCKDTHRTTPLLLFCCLLIDVWGHAQHEPEIALDFAVKRENQGLLVILQNQPTVSVAWEATNRIGSNCTSLTLPGVTDHTEFVLVEWGSFAETVTPVCASMGSTQNVSIKPLPWQ